MIIPRLGQRLETDIDEVIANLREEIKEAIDDRWFCVIGVCDICSEEDMFFIPAEAYDKGIVGCECAVCGNQSVFPKEEEEEEND